MKLIGLNDCKACHGEYKKSIGPAFYAVSMKYKADKNALEKLTRKVISGGSGVWGDVSIGGFIRSFQHRMHQR